MGIQRGLYFFPTSIRVEIACLVSAFTAFLIFIDFESNCLTFNFVSVLFVISLKFSTSPTFDKEGY